MKTLMTTTALVATIASANAAFAENTDSPFVFESAAENDLHASSLIGMRVYTVEPAADGSAWDMTDADGLQTDWQDVGEINDLIVTRDGNIASVLVDIGGFLGIGERQIAMDMEDIRFVSDKATEDANDFFLVIPAAMADFEAAPEYDRSAMTMQHGGTSDNTIASAEVKADKSDMSYNATAMTFDEVATLTTEDLTGARVYDSEGDWIGEVSQLILAESGQISSAIIDVGGFLGLGEKPVDLPMTELTINRYDEGGLRVTVPMTEEQLEQLPTWQG